MTWLTAYRAFWRTLLTCATAEKFTEFGIHFLALGDQLLNSRDPAVYFHVHHLLSEFVHTRWRGGRQLITEERMFRYVPPPEAAMLYDACSRFITCRAINRPAGRTEVQGWRLKEAEVVEGGGDE
jgi:hypothetical protein